MSNTSVQGYYEAIRNRLKNYIKSDYLLGDVNNDGEVDATDYLRIKSHFLGTITLEGNAFKAGDVTKDTVIDATDYLRIKGHFLGTYNLHI